MGLATVHSESAETVVDRLITLIKKDIKAQYYSESFLKQILATSIDFVIYIDKFKVQKIIKCENNEGRVEFQNILPKGEVECI